MDSLPQSIVNDILDFATDGLYSEFNLPAPHHRSQLASLATVSRKFQYAIERNTFKTLFLDLDRIRSASTTLSQFSRWKHLRDIVFFVMLPEYDEAACTRYENEAEQVENSRLLTQNIVELFHLLSQRPAQYIPATLSLKLDILSRSDIFVRYSTPDQGLVSRRFTHAGPVPGDMGSCRHMWSKILLDESVSLASIKHLQLLAFSLAQDGICRQVVHTDTIRRLTSAIMQSKPNGLALTFHDAEYELSRRIANRENVAHIIDSFPKLNKVVIKFYFLPHLNHNIRPPVLLDQDSQSDPVSCALRRLSQRSTSISITGTLCSTELFWPKDHLPGAPSPRWESLETLDLLYRPMTPGGKWLFERDDSWTPRVIREPVRFFDPVERRPRENRRLYQWRYSPIQQIMDEFYIAVGQAVANMPKLMKLSLVRIDDPEWRLDGSCLHAFSFQVFEDKRALAYWAGSPGYSPSEAVLKAWTRAAYERGVILMFQVENHPIRDRDGSEMPDTSIDDDEEEEEEEEENEED
ncbi:hypothetical protein K449DRAFT_426464 [Hypoxylon sp. EC38]|nr:hypothetical protein K449DRAFT_426464 [Hypoxylon sp. EC38]